MSFIYKILYKVLPSCCFWLTACWLSLASGLSHGAVSFLGNDQHPLAVHEAFVFDYDQTNTTLLLIWQIADEYYMYQDKMSVSINGQELALALPQGKVKDDPLFGMTHVYTQQVKFSVNLAAFQSPMSVVVDYQGCWEGGVCYPPQTSALTLHSTAMTATASTSISSVNLPNTTNQYAATMEQLTNASWFTNTLGQIGFVGLLFIFFIAGMALSLTPCMLPMVPILSNLIVGMQPRPGAFKSFLLSLSYVVAMAITYSAAGVASGLSGANLQMALQQPWTIGTLVLMFVLFAVAMFGWINLQIPLVAQNKLNGLFQKQAQGQFLGVTVMGMISALIVGPCVAAPLAGALLYIGQTGDPYTGGAALFSLGMGMGLPLLIVGTSMGKLLPKTGVWMSRVNYSFGLLMLYMSVWQLDRIVPSATVPLVALITLVMAILLWQIGRWQPPVKTLLGSTCAYLLAALFTLYSASLVVSMLVGKPSLINPLSSVLEQTNNTTQVLPKITPQKIQSSALPALLQKAKLEQRPVLLDFYADWCITCKELDTFVFPASDVQEALQGWEFLKVDITNNTSLDQSLLAQYQLVGPPALVFFDTTGKMLASQTIVGVPSARTLATKLKRLSIASE